MRTFMKEPNPDVVAFLEGRVKAAFSVLAAHLADRDWVVGNRATIADLSLCGYMFFEDEIGVNFSESYPAIARWLDRIKALPNWKHPYELMPGHPVPEGAPDPGGEALLDRDRRNGSWIKSRTREWSCCSAIAHPRRRAPDLIRGPEPLGAAFPVIRFPLSRE